MKSECYIGIDLGAESGRVMAGLWNGKRIRLEELHRFPNGPVEIGGTLRWDVLRLWSEIQLGLRVAARKFGKAVKSVGVDTWGVDFVLLSKRNELLGQPFHYRDSRTRGVMERAFKRLSRPEIFAATGLQFMEFNTLYQLLALKQIGPEVLAAADCLLMMPDFFHWCLCGSRVAEFTDATTTQFFDPMRNGWSRKVLERFNLPTRILPGIVPPGTRLGPLLDSNSRQTGLGRIAIIAPASHDTGSAVAAVPTEPRAEGTWAYLSSGTWSRMGVELREPRLSARALQFNLTNEGGVDGTYRLLKNISGLWLVQQSKRAFDRDGKKRNYGQLVRLAQRAPSLTSLVNPDHTSFMNPADMPAAIRHFCRRTRQPVPQSEGAVVRCALESLALKYQSVLQNLEEVGGHRIQVIHIVGGGSQNGLLNQFAADACQRPVLSGPVEATVLGNVLMQARACGELGSLAELRSVVRSSCKVRAFHPKPSNAAAWNIAQDAFNRICSR